MQNVLVLKKVVKHSIATRITPMPAFSNYLLFLCDFYDISPPTQATPTRAAPITSVPATHKYHSERYPHTPTKYVNSVASDMTDGTCDNAHRKGDDREAEKQLNGAPGREFGFDAGADG